MDRHLGPKEKCEPPQSILWKKYTAEVEIGSSFHAMEQTSNIEESITANQNPATLLKPVLLPDLLTGPSIKKPKKILTMTFVGLCNIALALIEIIVSDK